MLSIKLFNCTNRSLKCWSSQKLIAPCGIKNVPVQNFSNISLTKHCLRALRCRVVVKCDVTRSISIHVYRSLSLCRKNTGLLYHVRRFHTSERRNAIPPLLLVVLRPIFQLVAIIFGRTFRKWWASLPPERKQAITEKVKKNLFPILGFFAALTGVGVHYYVSHLEQEPITKRWRFIAFTKEQMLQIAKMELDTQIEEYRGMILNANHSEYTRVVRVAKRILKANQDLPGVTDIDWTVTVVGHPTQKNAFVLPNGSIFIFTGMLDVCENDDQLGVIISHEMSHALLGHMAEQLSNVQLIEWLLMIPLLIIWAVLPDGTAIFSQWLSSRFASLIFHLPFSRNIENEADRVGLELAGKACFDIREASAFWSKMATLSEGDNTIEWLSTHPSHETREQTLNKMMPTALKRRAECNCPALPHRDPRVMFPQGSFNKNLESNKKWEERLKKIS